MRALKTRKPLLYVVPIGVVAVLATIAYFATAGGAEADAEEQELQTATARRGDLSLVATGTGTLIPATEVELGFDTTGELTAILVEVGDEVDSGQLLARLDPTSAEASLAESESVLRELTSPLAVAQAQLAVANARQALQTAQYTNTVQQEGHRATEETIKSAKAKLVMAREALDAAKDRYDGASGSLSEDAGKAQAYIGYAGAKSAYNSALATYNWYTGHPTEIEQAQLEADVALAEAKLAEAEVLLAALKGEALPEGAFGSGLTALEKALGSVESARQGLAATELRASVAGTITAINATVGETVGGSSVMTLMDLSQPHVELYLDQTDIDKAAAGAEVEVIFDAYPDVVYTGTVTAIDPVLTSSGGVSALHGFAALDRGGSSARTRTPFVPRGAEGVETGWNLAVFC